MSQTSRISIYFAFCFPLHPSDCRHRLSGLFKGFLLVFTLRSVDWTGFVLVFELTLNILDWLMIDWLIDWLISFRSVLIFMLEAHTASLQHTVTYTNQLTHCMRVLQWTRSGADADEQECRYLLKMSARPTAVAVTKDSQLIVGSSGGRLVVFNLEMLMLLEGKCVVIVASIDPTADQLQGVRARHTMWWQHGHTGTPTFWTGVPYPHFSWHRWRICLYHRWSAEIKLY